jgi:hypothetical protein
VRLIISKGFQSFSHQKTMACHTLRHSINFVKKIGINLAYEEGYVIGKGTEVFQFKGCKYLIDFDDSFNQRVVSSLSCTFIVKLLMELRIKIYAYDKRREIKIESDCKFV